MKSKKQIFGLIALLNVTFLGIVHPELILADAKNSEQSVSKVNSFQCDSINCDRLKQESQAPVRCDEEGNCYREPPKSMEIPHIITPRQRKEIYAKKLILRWQPVDGTLAYTIHIAGSGVNWKKQVDGGQWWTYYDGPTLQAGAEYLFMVNANNGYESSRETFKIITAEKAREIDEEIDRLQQTIPAAEERDLAIAQFYRNEGLIVDAIDTLEALINRESNNSDVYCLLSQLYRDLDLDDLATSIDRLSSDRDLSCPS